MDGGHLERWVPAIPDPALVINRGDVDVARADFETGKAFACEVVDQVVRRRMTATGVTDFLKLIQRHYGPHLEDDAPVIPTSWYQIKKLATDGHMPKYVMRHLCTQCDWIFPILDQSNLCGQCHKHTRWEEKKHGRPARTAVYFDMADMFQRMFAVPVMKEALKRFAETTPSNVPIQDRELNEAIDGSILHGLVSSTALSLHSAEENSSSDDEVGDQQPNGRDGESESESNSEQESTSNSESESNPELANSDDDDDEVQCCKLLHNRL